MKLGNRSRLWLSFALVFALVFSLMAPISAQDVRGSIKLDFTDVKDGSWAKEYIQRMWAMDVLSGDGDGSFRPNDPINRAEAMVTAVRLMGLQDEAEDKPDNAKLHFRDADLIEDRFPWAKGYILVGLENGLFDTSDDVFRPGAAADRWWVAALMVRALGLQEEALENMSSVPDFEDAHRIPAGAVGYIHVAIENELVSGYPDGTFRPGQAVTRAEMAVLLSKTGELIEQEWMQVEGEVQSIQFSDRSVSRDVYRMTDGTVVVETDRGDEFKLHISSRLLVQFDNDRYMRADQLRVGDKVVFWTKDGVVLRATLDLFGTNHPGDDGKKEEEDNEIADQIRKFKVVLKNDDEQFLLEYETKKGKVKHAKLERTDDDRTSKLEGKDAIGPIEDLLEKLDLSSDLSDQRVKNRLFRELSLHDFDYEQLEIRVIFTDGGKINIEEDLRDDDDRDRDWWKRDRDRDDDRNRYGDGWKRDGNRGAVMIEEIEVKLIAGPKGQIKIEWERDDGDYEAEVEIKVRNQHEKLKGREALEWIEKHIGVPKRGDFDRDELLERLLDAMDWNRSDIRNMKVEGEWTDGSEFKWKL